MAYSTCPIYDAATTMTDGKQSKNVSFALGKRSFSSKKRLFFIASSQQTGFWLK